MPRKVQQVPDRAIEYERNLRRLVAIVAAVSDMSCSVPGDDPKLQHVQCLLSAAEEWAEQALTDGEHLLALLSAVAA